VQLLISALEADLADASWHKLFEGLGVRLVVAPSFEGLEEG
jgi:hypothetical protein